MSRFTVDQLPAKYQQQVSEQLHGKPPIATVGREAPCCVCGTTCFLPANATSPILCRECVAAGCVPRRPVAVAGQTKPAQAKTAPRQPKPAKGQGARQRAKTKLYAHHHADSPAPDTILERRHADEPLSTDQIEARHPRRYVVRFTSHRVQLLDEDNLCVKYVCDGLRHAGIIPDDSPDQAHIEVAQVKVAHKADEKTVIEVFAP